MGTRTHSVIYRWAQSFLQLALQFWPPESRHWGLALASELPETNGTFETLQWTLGGLMLFTRASVSHFLSWMKNPPGSPLSVDPVPPGDTPPILPRRSRLFAAALLAATLLLLFFPQSRIAISAARASWSGLEIGASDHRTLQKMASRAQAERDAQTLAFVALALPDSERAMALADRAVALDPNLTWIYASRFYRPDGLPLPDAWRDRSLTTDPDNAFIHLAAADSVANAHVAALVAHRTPPPQEIESAITSDPEWVSQMEQAIRSRRYDAYLSQHWDLVRRTWDRNTALSPAIIGYSLWSGRIPNIHNLQTFAHVRVRLAQQKRLAGQPDQASQILAELDAFGARMEHQAGTQFEQSIGLDLSRQANAEFAVLYASTGRKQEADQASARSQALEARQLSFQPLFKNYLARQDSIRRPAILFQSALLLFLLSVLVAALSYLVLELLPRRSSARGRLWQLALCRVADYVPVAVLLFAVASVVSFLPFVRIFADYRSSAASLYTYRGLSDTFWALTAIPSSLLDHFGGAFFWWPATIALSLIAFYLLWRNFRRVRPAPQPTAL